MQVEIFKAGKNILQEKAYLKGFFVVMVLIYSAYIIMPVYVIPGNDLAFQLSIMKPQDFIVFFLISAVTALLVVMQVFVYKRTKQKRKLAAVGEGGVSLYSSIFGGLLATAACSSCIVGILGFLGAGTTLFIVENQIPFVIGAFAIVLISLYFVSKRVNEHCSSCEIARSK